MNFKHQICNNEWVVYPDGSYFKCWDECNRKLGNIKDTPQLKGVVLCTISNCKSALFTEKEKIDANSNDS